MSSTVEIQVVDHDGEQLFQLGDVLFDQLEAYQEFEGGRLQVFRDGVEVSTTSNIEERGTHAACTCFCDLTLWWDDGTAYDWWATSAVSPDNFWVGDVLVLEILVEDFDFAGFLRERCAGITALRNVLDRQQGPISIGQIGQEYNQEIEVLRQQAQTREILRFIG